MLFFFFVSAFFHPLAAADVLQTDRELLEKIQKDTLQYFIRKSDKNTGLTKDSSRMGSPASIAATGFSLSAFSIAASKEWVEWDYAKNYLEKTLDHLLHHADHKRGFFYHFLDPKTGKRVWASEASSIDTALLLAGALLAGQYFPGTKIPELARKLYERTDWQWMLNGSLLVCMGWKPESGFLPYYWDTYNEHLLIQALAIGSPTHPIPPQAWNEWDRLEDDYNGHRVVYSHSGSLFTYQFPHAYLDFRNLNDRGINYFQNSVNATLANRDYSLAHRMEHRGYSETSWGLSASTGPGGYKAYGAKPGIGLHDGTLTPNAVIGSIVFTPEESMKAVRHFYQHHQENLYGHFGFKDAFNLDKNWWAEEYLGIDQGIIILMLENYLSDGIIWKKFSELKWVRDWVERAGLETTG